MGDTYTYNQRDIRRYLDNEMTAEQMHAFERAMMDDPFLADALEGYKNSDPVLAQEHLSLIENEIKNAGNNKKGILVTRQGKTAWWRIAALFVVLAGAGIFYLKTINNSQEINLAQNTTLPPARGEVDSIKPLENAAPSPELFKEKQTLSKKSIAASSPAPESYERDTERMALSVSPGKSNEVEKDQLYQDKANDVKALSKTSAPMAARAPMDSASMQLTREFKGRVVDDNQKPLPYANIKADNINAVTDNNGNFTIKAPDSLLKVNVSSVGYASVNSQISSNKADNKIMLKEADRQIDEVVVVGYGSEKKKRDLASTANKQAKEEKKEAEAEPEGGWQSFQEYVYRQLKKERDTSNTYLSGDVLVEFDIDEKGKPRDVTVQQSESKEIADKAVRLIETGPRWKKNTRNKRAKVLIKF